MSTSGLIVTRGASSPSRSRGSSTPDGVGAGELRAEEGPGGHGQDDQDRAGAEERPVPAARRSATQCVVPSWRARRCSRRKTSSAPA